MTEFVGKVTQEECAQIKNIYERLIALKELVPSLTPDNDALYEKVLLDVTNTKNNYNNWWKSMKNKYNFAGKENCNWYINFDTCEVSLSDIR